MPRIAEGSSGWGEFASWRVTRESEKVVAERGRLLALRCDNGPEFRSRHFPDWGLERKIELVHIEPGKPVQNAPVESFNGKLRDECLNASWFGNLWEARMKIGAWRKNITKSGHTVVGHPERSREKLRRSGRLRLPARCNLNKRRRQKS